MYLCWWFARLFRIRQGFHADMRGQFCQCHSACASTVAGVLLEVLRRRLRMFSGLPYRVRGTDGSSAMNLLYLCSLADVLRLARAFRSIMLAAHAV